MLDWLEYPGGVCDQPPPLDSGLGMTGAGVFGVVVLGFGGFGYIFIFFVLCFLCFHFLFFLCLSTIILV